jgi:hypothetical protein
VTSCISSISSPFNAVESVDAAEATNGTFARSEAWPAERRAGRATEAGENAAAPAPRKSSIDSGGLASEVRRKGIAAGADK